MGSGDLPPPAAHGGLVCREGTHVGTLKEVCMKRWSSYAGALAMMVAATVLALAVANAQAAVMDEGGKTLLLAQQETVPGQGQGDARLQGPPPRTGQDDVRPQGTPPGQGQDGGRPQGPPPRPVEDRQEIRNDRQEIRQDQRELNRDRQELQRDLRVRQDLEREIEQKMRSGDTVGADAARAKLQNLNREINKDRREINQDKRELNRDRQDMRQDRQDQRDPNRDRQDPRQERWERPQGGGGGGGFGGGGGGGGGGGRRPGR